MTILSRLSLIFCLSIFSHSSFGAYYYVSPSGDDSNPGTGSQPWKTIQYSIDQLMPGDGLTIGPGIYNEKVVFHNSGSPGLPITLLGSMGAILDGTGLTGSTAMIDITDQSYIFIRGLEIRNNVMYDAQGIVVQGNCQGIYLQSNKIHDIHFSSDPLEVAAATKNAQGIIVWGTDPNQAVSNLIIRGNELFNCRLGYSEGIAINGNVDGFVVESNFVHDLTNIGIVAIGHEGTCSDPLLDQARSGSIDGNFVYGCHSPYAACGGIYVDGAKDISITANSVHDNDYGIEVGCEHPGKTASAITVRNNIIRLNTVAGMALGGYDYPSQSGSVVDCSVYNNSFWANDSLYDGNGEVIITYIENCIIENNLFAPNFQNRAVTFADPASTGVLLNYNLYFTEDSDQSTLIASSTTDYTLSDFQLTGQETNGFFADPLLNFSDNDYSFALFDFSSPCIDAGNPNYVLAENESDFFGGERLGFCSEGVAVDIGASELSCWNLTELQLTTSLVFPNPASSEIFVQSDEQWSNFEIIDLSGKIQKSGSFSGGPISVSCLDSGAYIVRCYNAQKVSTTSFIKL